MAGPGVCAGPGVRGPAAGGRAGGDGVRAARPRCDRHRGVQRVAGAAPGGARGSADARTLLATAVRAPLDDVVRDRIVAEARGNPLALLELPRGAPPVQLAGGFELPDVVSVPRRVEDGFRRRSGSLPPDTQLLLVVAAAEPTGDAALLWRAAAELGIAREAAAPGGGRRAVGARHPGAVPAPAGALGGLPGGHTARPRRAHGALAAVTDPQVDPDRRAWHRAQAVVGTDEEVAAELERSAGRARARGGLAAAAAFLQRAAELTPEPAVRAGRALEAAHAKHEAGASEAALELLTVAATGPLDALQQARLELLRAQIAFHLTQRRRGAADAAGRRQEPRPAGRGAVPRDLPGRARCGDRHRRPRPRRRRASRGRSRPGRARTTGVAEAGGSVARRAGDDVHAGLRGRRARAAAGVGGLRPPRARRSCRERQRQPPLAVAGQPNRDVGLRRRDGPRAGRLPRPAGP